MRAGGPVTTDIVLVGGGHAHVQVMTRLAMAGTPGLRLTLVTEALQTPYSGMLPGLVAGQYDLDDVHIDLARLSLATGTRLIHARAIGIDRTSRRVLLDGRPPIAYDVVSLNTGIVPDFSDIPGAKEHGIPVKPISGFLDRLAVLIEALRKPDGPRRFLVVGGGAAGIELALTLRRRLDGEALRAGIDPRACSVGLVTSAALVPTLNAGTRQRAAAKLAAAGIAVVEKARVVRITADAVHLEDGRAIGCDAAVVSTKARAPQWLSTLGLETAPDGSLLVDTTLRTPGDTRVFAVGDCASPMERPLDKAGVFAVRQGLTLAGNLRRVAVGLVPRRWRPQQHVLVILNAGDGTAIAGRGRHFAVEGRWVWRWKDDIDRRFMRMFSRFGRLGPVEPDATGEVPPAFRCAGCAAKVGPGPLARALDRLPAPPATPFLARLLPGHARDDAAVFSAGEGGLELETVDLITAFLDDPYRFGEIAALHALSDVYAMGGRPTRALAIAVLPHARAEIVAEDLFQLLSGARAALDREGVALIGGHSGEGAALALGLAVTGEAAPSALRTKAGLRPGDAIILTKPLGTGLVFAAGMRGAAHHRAIAAALDSQRLSNAGAARVLAAHGVTGLTDVTGFGLLGHLADMLAASGCGAVLSPALVPALDGARALSEAGFGSSVLSQNAAGIADLLEHPLARAEAALLLDPQTSGGLLAGLPADRAEDVLLALRSEGYTAAARIGTVTEAGHPLIRLA